MCVTFFSFHTWPNVSFFTTNSSSSSSMFLFGGDKFAKILCYSFHCGQWSPSSYWGNLHTVFSDYTACIGSLLLKIHTKYLLCERLVSAGSTTALKKNQNPLCHSFGTLFLVIAYDPRKGFSPENSERRKWPAEQTWHGFILVLNLKTNKQTSQTETLSQCLLFYSSFVVICLWY